MSLAVLSHFKHCPFEFTFGELITPRHSWRNTAIPGALCGMKPPQLKRESLTRYFHQLHNTWITFEPSMTSAFCWPLASAQWVFVMIISSHYTLCVIEPDVWRGELYSILNRLEKPTEAMKKIPFTLYWMKTRKLALCYYFWLLSMLLHLSLNDILFTHPGTLTTELSLTNNSRCLWNSKTSTETLTFHRNLYEILKCLK